MATATSTGSWLDPPELHGKRNNDGTFTLEELELKKLNDYNRKVAKMIQGGLNLANLNEATNQTFTDTNGNVAELALTAMGLELDVGNLAGDLTSLSVTVDGMRVADETGSYTIINGDKLVSKDHDTGAATVIEDGEIKVYSDLDNFFWAGSLGYAYPGVFLIQNLSSGVPLKINGIGNMSIDASASGAIYLGTSNSGEDVEIGNSGGTVTINGSSITVNGNPLGAAVFT